MHWPVCLLTSPHSNHHYYCLHLQSCWQMIGYSCESDDKFVFVRSCPLFSHEQSTLACRSVIYYRQSFSTNTAKFALLYLHIIIVQHLHICNLSSQTQNQMGFVALIYRGRSWQPSARNPYDSQSELIDYHICNMILAAGLYVFSSNKLV